MAKTPMHLRVKGYSAVHKWVYRHYGKAYKCELCQTDKAKVYNWSNISGKYLRQRLDWQMLCVSCHKKYDLKLNPISDYKLHTHCKRGHEFSPDNVRIDKRGYRICLACHRIHQAKYTKKQAR